VQSASTETWACCFRVSGGAAMSNGLRRWVLTVAGVLTSMGSA